MHADQTLDPFLQNVPITNQCITTMQSDWMLDLTNVKPRSYHSKLVKPTWLKLVPSVDKKQADHYGGD